MFSTLIYSVFPALDRFFTFLSSIAIAPYHYVCDFIFSDSLSPSIVAHGFTGQTFTWYPVNAGGALAPLFRVASNTLGSLFGINDTPFVFALLIIFSSLFLLVLVVRFAISAFTRVP